MLFSYIHQRASGICMFWRLLTWGWRVGIAHGRGAGRGGKHVDQFLGNDSLWQINPRNLVISQLGREEFQASSDRGRVTGGERS